MNPWHITVAGPWAIDVRRADGASPRRLAVEPANMLDVEGEEHASLTLYDATAAGWRRGVRLRECVSDETSVADALDPCSVRVRVAGAGVSAPLTEGVDYALDPVWATLGRLPGGSLGPDQAVQVDYRCGLGRLDALVLPPGGEPQWRRGRAHICSPLPPALRSGEQRLANLWLPPRLPKLEPTCVLPLLPPIEPPAPAAAMAVQSLLPGTLAKLERGEFLRVLAWGDSVTDAGYLQYTWQRWQDRWVAGLRKRFPAASIELVTAAWPGGNSRGFLDQPDDSPHSYRARVLAFRPDLVVSEFVNDAYLGNEKDLEELYGRFLQDFREIGAEWIILTPHYVRPDWMGLDRQFDIDDDPRPYVHVLRAFAQRHNVALADAAALWGGLWRQGIPYTTLLRNAINHPDARGMRLFVEALDRILGLTTGPIDWNALLATPAADPPR